MIFQKAILKKKNVYKNLPVAVLFDLLRVLLRKTTEVRCKGVVGAIKGSGLVLDVDADDSGGLSSMIAFRLFRIKPLTGGVTEDVELVESFSLGAAVFVVVEVDVVAVAVPVPDPVSGPVIAASAVLEPLEDASLERSLELALRK